MNERYPVAHHCLSKRDVEVMGCISKDEIEAELTGEVRKPLTGEYFLTKYGQITWCPIAMMEQSYPIARLVKKKANVVTIERVA